MGELQLHKTPFLIRLAEKEWLIILLWFGISVFAAGKEIWYNNINNYLVFKHVYLHVAAQQPLYILYPEQYFDVNLYGPVFSFVIAPFTFFPDPVGALLWAIANSAFLYVAIRQLPLTRLQQNFILLFCCNELFGASSYLQFNQGIAACIILSFALILKGKDFWAAALIIVGTLTKLYGIAGLAFFFFSGNRWTLTKSLFFWGIVLFLLPMLLSSPGYIIQTYGEWMHALVSKNDKNVMFTQDVLLQDISAMGFIRRTFHIENMPNGWVIIPALFIFFAQYIMLAWRRNSIYRLYILCSALLFPLLFSSSSEAATYIMGFPAICIWYVIQTPAKWKNAVFIFALIFCSFAHSDLLTPWVRHNISVPYAIKALPCLIVWLIIAYQILTKQFNKNPVMGVTKGNMY